MVDNQVIVFLSQFFPNQFPYFNLPLATIYVTHASRALQSHYLSGEGISCGSHTYDHTRTWRASTDECSAQCRATFETARTLKTIHIIQSLILTGGYEKDDSWWQNDIRGPSGPKVSWQLSYRWGKTPKNSHPGNLFRPEIETEPAARQTRMLPPAPQRCSFLVVEYIVNFRVVIDLNTP